MNELYLKILILLLNVLMLIVLIAIPSFFLVKKRKRDMSAANSNKVVNKEMNKREVSMSKESLLDNSNLSIHKVDPSIVTTGKLIESTDRLKKYSTDLLRLAKSNTPYLTTGKEVFEVVFIQELTLSYRTMHFI
ncbi:MULTISPECIES: hypothetical protein [Peribacillus]|uniref:hypothetical protein n=1 Tax=Peribacillus TaxID=2675229 RepID=UPI0033358B67